MRKFNKFLSPLCVVCVNKKIPLQKGFMQTYSNLSIRMMMMMIVIINYVHDLNVILTGNLEKNMSPEMCMIANCKMVLIFNVCPVQKSVFPCAYWPDSKSVTNYSAMFPRTPFYM